MSGERERSMEGWTVPLKEHIEALAAKDALLDRERDRRYAEVNTEREKALKIKDEADKDARVLAREIQDGKDEKANMLREQIGSERNLYATKDDLMALGQRLVARTFAMVTVVISVVGIIVGVVLSLRGG